MRSNLEPARRRGRHPRSTARGRRGMERRPSVRIAIPRRRVENAPQPGRHRLVRGSRRRNPQAFAQRNRGQAHRTLRIAWLAVLLRRMILVMVRIPAGARLASKLGGSMRIRSEPGETIAPGQLPSSHQQEQKQGSDRELEDPDHEPTRGRFGRDRRARPSMPQQQAMLKPSQGMPTIVKFL